MRFVYALASLVAPGLGHALGGHRRAAFAWALGICVVMATAAVTVWAIVAIGVVWLAGAAAAAIVRPQPDRRRAVDIAAIVVLPIVAALGLRAGVVEAFKIPSSSMCPTFEIGDHLFINKLSRSPSRGDLVVFRQPCDPERDYIERVVGLPGDTVEIRCDVVYVNGQPDVLDLVAADDHYDDHDDETDEWLAKPVTRWRETSDGASYEVFHAAGRVSGLDEPADHKDFPDRRRGAPSCRDFASVHDDDGDAGGDAALLKDLGKPDAKACDQQLQYVVPQGQVFALGDSRNNSNDSRFWGGIPLDNIKGKVVGIWMARDAGRIGAVH